MAASPRRRRGRPDGRLRFWHQSAVLTLGTAMSRQATLHMPRKAASYLTEYNVVSHWYSSHSNRSKSHNLLWFMKPSISIQCSSCNLATLCGS
jgi:hypothetical protein